MNNAKPENSAYLKQTHFKRGETSSPKRVISFEFRPPRAGSTRKTTFDVSLYSDEQLNRKENPVIFTLNPDFTITASEKGSLSEPAVKVIKKEEKKEEGDLQSQLKECKTTLSSLKRELRNQNEEVERLRSLLKPIVDGTPEEAQLAVQKLRGQVGINNFS